MSIYRWRRFPLLIAGVILLIAAAALTVHAAGSPGRVPNTTAGQPLNLLEHVDRFVFDTPALMCQSDLVVDAQFAGRGTSHWTTPNGQRPQGVDSRTLLARGYSIVTPINFASAHPLLDHRRLATSEFVVLGGQVGQDRIASDSAPLKAGSRYVLVAVPNADAQTGRWTERSLVVLDAFPIDSQGMVTLRPQIIEQGKVSQALVRVSLSQLHTQVGSC
jgi:hypothetical protein